MEGEQKTPTPLSTTSGFFVSGYAGLCGFFVRARKGNPKVTRVVAVFVTLPRYRLNENLNKKRHYVASRVWMPSMYARANF